MSLLTPRDREYILNQLKLAPDSVLADAMLAFNAIRDKLMAVRKLTTPDNDPALTEAVNPVPERVDRPNVAPGKPAIERIGSATKDDLLRMLQQGVTPPAKYTEHLKLLWERGAVRFDGKDYYL